MVTSERCIVCVSLCGRLLTIPLYPANGKMHYSLYALLLVMLTLFVINDMMLIINFIFVKFDDLFY